MCRWAFALSLVALAACRDPPRAVEEAGTAEATEAARPVRVEAGVVTLVEPACEGPSLLLLEAAMDPRCAVSDAEWSEPTPAEGLAQEAKSEGAFVVFALVNRGRARVSVPLRFDDRAPGRAFSVVAELEGDAAGIFALAPPALDLPPTDAAVHVHSARIRLPPGGRAYAKLTIDRHVVDRLDKRGVDAGALPAGPMTLHIGQLWSPLEMGEQAKVRFMNDLSKR